MVYLLKRTLCKAVNKITYDLSCSAPKPKLKKTLNARRALIFSVPEKWDCLITQDAAPNFDVITYSHEGNQAGPREKELLGWSQHLSFNTEFFGSSFVEIIKNVPDVYQHTLIVNSDVAISYSDINKLFSIVELYELDICQPSMSPNGYHSILHLIHNPLLDIEFVKHIEPMVFCLSRRVISELRKVDDIPISGWGIAVVHLENIRERLDLQPSAVIHAIKATHCKPLESNEVRFSNGLTAREELDRLKQKYSK